MNSGEGMADVLGEVPHTPREDSGGPHGRSSAGALPIIALCVDPRGSSGNSVQAARVQCSALTLLTAAALFSPEGHAQARDIRRDRTPIIPIDYFS